ncbi:hypothetical protein PANDA_014565, partial [Ailuropoda melanoleuca]
ASRSPEAQRRGAARLVRFQLAPIKKLEGSLQIHFLLSSFHPTMTFPGGAGGGEGGRHTPPEDLGRNINAQRLPGSGRRSGRGPVGSRRVWKPVAEPPVGGTDPPAGCRGRPSPNEN